jgi:SAM-dependent MidA family methyltransferase
VSLRQKIEREIRANGPIPFSRYMEMCLYDPELGYYSRHAEKFGKAGDFYTSSDVHAVFGRLMARQFDEMWRALGSPAEIELLELGPGRGLFAQDVLDWSEKKFPEFYGALRYTLDERSPSLRERLEARFRERIESGKVTMLSQDKDSRVDIESPMSPNDEPQRLKPPLKNGIVVARLKPGPFKASAFKAGPFKGGHELESVRGPIEAGNASIAATSGNRGLNQGRAAGTNREGHGFSHADSCPTMRRASAPEVPLIVFANEFFDALPVEVLSETGSLRIDVRDGRLVETWAPASQEELEFLDRYGVHPTGADRTESALVARHCMSQIAAKVQRGFLIAIDYGYTREEQLAGRHVGTVMAYRQHSASPNPYEAPGEQDITAHVNFTALTAAAEENGMQVHTLLTQSQFLMGIGEANQFADAFEDCRLPQERAKVALQLKHLVTPAGMGETFHVLVASKGVDRSVMDGLSGLGFGKDRALE